MFNLINGDCLEELDKLKENSIDSIVTDPPYELNFMGKGWDNAGISFQKETWEKCLRVLKPGGYLLAFGGSRTFHRIACAIEDAGFEIRDTIMWLYGSGFPKSMNIGLAIDKKNGVESKVVATGKSGAKETHQNSLNLVKNPFGGEYEIKEAQNEWNGWGTALKPSFEPIIVARKPFKGSLVDNVIKWGVGGFNIDECRVGTGTGEKKKVKYPDIRGDNYNQGHHKYNDTVEYEIQDNGRFPANTILTYDETDFDEVCGGFPETKSGVAVRHNSGGNTFGGNNKKPPMSDLGYRDSGNACRYFYCAKASKKDRDEGCDTLKDGLLRRMRPDKDDSNPTGLNKEGRFAPVVRKNTHPTVKPTSLMQYLVRLVSPKGATILDPFMGSGSTGKAVAYENLERNVNYKFIGIEKEKEYCDIAEARINYVKNKMGE